MARDHVPFHPAIRKDANRVADFETARANARVRASGSSAERILRLRRSLHMTHGKQRHHLRVSRFAALKRLAGVVRLHVAGVIGLVAGAREDLDAERGLALINEALRVFVKPTRTKCGQPWRRG